MSMTIQPLSSGYYDTENQMCMLDPVSEDKSEGKPGLVKVGSSQNKALAVVSEKQEGPPGFGGFVSGASDLAGCGTDEICENKNKNPFIHGFYLYNTEGNVHHTSYKPTEGEEVVLGIKAENCSENTNGLNVSVRLISSEAKETTGDAEYDSEKELFVFTFTAPPSKGGDPYKIIAEVTDSRIDETYYQAIYELYTKGYAETDFTLSKDCNPDEYNCYPNRPVSLEIIPPKDALYEFNYSWTIENIDNQDLAPFTATGKSIEFPPPEKGNYYVSVTVQAEEYNSPINVEFPPIEIKAFPPAPVTLQGPKDVKPGETQYYTASILRDWDEDNAATCNWQVSHLDPTTGQTTIDLKFGEQAQACDLAFTFPDTVLTQTSYLIQAKVTGENNVYEIEPNALPITLYPNTESQNLKADFLVSYHEDGAIPFRPVYFDAVLLDMDLGSNYAYEWEIYERIYERDENGAWKELALLDGISAQYPFPKDNKYKIKLSVYETIPATETEEEKKQLISSKEQLVTIYRFPKPSVDIDINGNQAVHTGELVPITLQIGRDWLEDQAAIVSFNIDALPEKYQCDANSDSKNIVDCIFHCPGTYLIEASVIGKHNNATAYTVSASDFADVYLSGGSSVLSADYYINYPQDGSIPHRTFEFQGILNGAEQGAGYTYELVIETKNGDPYTGTKPTADPIDPLLFTHEFDEDGIYYLTFKAYNADNELISQKSKTVEVYLFPAPEIAINLNDNQPAFVGQPASLNGLILRNWPEDQNADFQITLDPAIPCLPANSAYCEFTPSESGIYLATLYVTGKNGQDSVYDTSTMESISVYEQAQGALSCDLGIDYPEDGSIPFRQFQFLGLVTGSQEGASYEYQWYFESKDDQAYTGNNPLADAQNPLLATHTFDEKGNYFLTFHVSELDPNSNDVINECSKSKNIEVWPFPKPEIAIDINGNQPIFAGGSPAGFGVYLLRNWAEDNPPFIHYDWTITRKSTEDGQPGESIECTSSESVFSCGFNGTGELIIELTVNSQDGDFGYYAVEKIESSEVYPQQ